MKDGKYVIGIIDDDESFRDSTQYFLEKNGYFVWLFESGVDFIQQFKTSARLQHELDLVTLDILMPGIDGHGLLDTIRSEEQYKGLKVVIMSSENTLENRINLIEAGADDFTAKSDSIYEFLARINARLRDKVHTDTDSDSAPKTEGLTDDGTSIYGNGEKIDLTATEYKIMGKLLRNVDEYISKDELELVVFGRHLQSQIRALDFHLARIRKKLLNHKLPYLVNITARKGYGVKLSYES